MHIPSAASFVGALVSTSYASSGLRLPPGHHHVPAGPGDLRSPCPALNTLANHNFISHNGTGLAAADIVGAVNLMYNISSEFVATLVSGGISCCGSAENATLNLDALALHNAIEHDGSLVHSDAAPGAKFAPTTVNRTLLADLIAGHPNGLTLDDFAQRRVEIEKALATPLDAGHKPLALGEVALTLTTMGDENGVVSIEKLQQWYGEERFPDTYRIPKDEVTEAALLDSSAQVAAAMQKFQ